MKDVRKDLLHRIIGPRIASSTTPDASVCEACRSDAFALVEWGEHAADEWWVVLRCGECAGWQETVVSRAGADSLEAALDEGLEAIARDLEAVDRERLATQIQAFVVALERDLIDAGDFALPR
jgi:hypothetical protein